MNLFSLLIFSLLHILKISATPKCPEFFQCGNLGLLRFPLTEAKNPNCGLFTVDACNSTTNPKLRLDNGFSYEILQKVSSNKLFVSDHNLENTLRSNRCSTFTNLSPFPSPYISFSTPTQITFFTCTNQSYSESVQGYFRNYSHTSCPFLTVYYRHPLTGEPDRNVPLECTEMQLPAKANSSSSDFYDLLTTKFTLEWNVSQDCSECYERGGQCMSTNKNAFYCSKGMKKISKRIFLIGGVCFAAVTTTSVISFILFRKKHKLMLKLLGFRTLQTDNEKNIEIFLKNDGKHLQQTRYTYSDLKKITNSFSHSLGKGGYGSVYKGELRDGRSVAVKILNELPAGKGEEFINEVASISKTSHINIVALLGFCFEGARRALVYEFMPNGSLEKFVNNPTRTITPVGVVYQNNNFDHFLPESRLGWQKLFEIVVGIAEGLDYLHRGCSTRIFHFDIKPHNILLDKDLNPKISDFGLAKLCPNRSSIVSMSVVKGTIGYIAPEIIYRSLGEASHKSDVYSYGMMVLEMVMGKQRIDPLDDDHKSEIYFPNPIYKLLEGNDHVMNLGNIANEDESKLAKKMIIVGLWCVQIEPGNRPSIGRVLEMLHGGVELLEIPPKHDLFSDRRSAADDAPFSLGHLPEGSFSYSSYATC
ncbi:hypothetical protein ACS0TY_033354 [Phlomoides rotata]